jgi:titin
MGANSGCFSNTGLLPSTRYYYRVAAYNAAGRSAWIGPVSAKTQIAGTPDAPSDLAAVVVGGPGVDLTGHDNSNNETQFKIQRRELPDGSWTLLNSVGANVIAYADLTVQPGKTYEYRVRARNTSGNSSPTPTVSVTP